MIGIGSGFVSRSLPEAAYLKNSGVKSDGTTNDSAAIQTILNARKNLLFPIGNTAIGDKLTMPQSKPSEGIFLLGLATTSTDPINNPTTRERTSSIISWIGEASGTLIESTDTLNLVFENLVLHGKGSASILVHFKSSIAGSGVSRFVNCNFYDADTLVKCGVNTADTGNADLYFDQCGFATATYGLHVVNEQGLNYNFSQLSANSVDSVIRLTEGGSLKLFVANFVNTGNDANGDYSIHIEDSASNGFYSIIDGIRFEQGCDNFFYASNFGETVINGLVEAQNSTSTNKIKLLGHSLTATNSRITSWDNLVDMNSLSGKRPAIHFDNVYFDSQKTIADLPDMFTLNTNTRQYISFTQCRVRSSGGSPVMMGDWYSSIQLGPVIHSVQITGNGVTGNAYLFGETAQNQYNTLELSLGVNVLETRITGTETTSGEIIGATLTGTLHWDGATMTVLEQSVSNKYTDDASVFNNAAYVSSVMGARVQITNVTGTWNYIAVTRKLA